jgi:hypothetical protein
MDWFQCFNCRKLSMLADPAKPLCAACGSKHGEVINAKALEEAVDGRYDVVIEVLKRTKPKRPMS